MMTGELEAGLEPGGRRESWLGKTSEGEQEAAVRLAIARVKE